MGNGIQKGDLIFEIEPTDKKVIDMRNLVKQFNSIRDKGSVAAALVALSKINGPHNGTYRNAIRDAGLQLERMGLDTVVYSTYGDDLVQFKLPRLCASSAKSVTDLIDSVTYYEMRELIVDENDVLINLVFRECWRLINANQDWRSVARAACWLKPLLNEAQMLHARSIAEIHQKQYGDVVLFWPRSRVLYRINTFPVLDVDGDSYSILHELVQRHNQVNYIKEESEFRKTPERFHII